MAFDTGMLTVSADLKIHIAHPLADAARGDHFTRAVSRSAAAAGDSAAPDDAQRPRRRYLDWHREKIFVA
jgi:hypothetical protein